MIKTSALLCILTLLIFSCKKEEIEPEVIPQEEIPIETDTISNNYHPLTIGSYWVYEFDNHLPNGTIMDNNIIDTIKVLGDTVLNGESYFVFEKSIPFNSTYFRRLDLGNVVSHNGSLICPADINYSGTHNGHYGISAGDTVYQYWEEFTGALNIQSEFGASYDCPQMTAYHVYTPAFGGMTTADTNYFSAIGMLQRSYGYTNGSRQVGTLVDYHIE